MKHVLRKCTCTCDNRLFPSKEKTKETGGVQSVEMGIQEVGDLDCLAVLVTEKPEEEERSYNKKEMKRIKEQNRKRI